MAADSTHCCWAPSCWAEATQVLHDQGKTLTPKNLFLDMLVMTNIQVFILFPVLLLKKHTGPMSLIPLFSTQPYGTMRK